MGCLKLTYYQPEPTLKVMYGKTEPQQKLAQSWLSVDPLADERSWVSPYSYVQNSPVMGVDPSGALDTKYVDKEENTILETNDGSDAVIEVSDDRLDQFQDNISNADDIHSKEWNYDQKSFLTGVEWGDDVENVLMAQHSEEAMIAAQRYWRGDGSFSDYRKIETRAQYQDPEISAQALVMLASLGIIKMPAVKTGGIQLTKHAAQRMTQRGITPKMVKTGITKGVRYYDPKNGTFNYVLKNGYASGKDILIGVSPQSGKVTTVLRGNNLINKRFIPQ